MKSYTFGSGANTIRIDILRHRRTFPDADTVQEWFLVQPYLNGSPIDMFAGEGRRVDPEWFGFQGRRVVDVYQLISGSEDTGDAIYEKVGTKRGADFRSRFFKVVIVRTARAVRARQLNKTIGQLTEADVASAGTVLRNLCRGIFPDPVDLRTMALDDAAKFLRDNVIDPIEEGAL